MSLDTRQFTEEEQVFYNEASEYSRNIKEKTERKKISVQKSEWLLEKLGQWYEVMWLENKW